MKTRSKFLFNLFMFFVLLTALLGSPTLAAAANASGATSNGQFEVAVWSNGAWQTAGTLSFGMMFAQQQIDLSSFTLTNPALIRVTHIGATAAHIDTVTFGGQTPTKIQGASESAALSTKKLLARDYDVIDASRKSYIFTFPAQGSSSTLTLVARIEPEINIGLPFQFPAANFAKVVDNSSQFYSYQLNSASRALTINGDLSDEKLGTPFFKEWSAPTSGHPSNYTYGWVFNDAKNLYVAIDFTPDNTMDGEKDFTAVFVKTANGVQRFKASVPEQQWGKPGFVYTDRAAYQHKVYEFKIPLKQIGFSATNSSSVELAFEAYGTASLSSLTSSQNPSADGQSVTFTVSGSETLVAFKDNGVDIPGCGAIAVSGTGTCTTSSLSVGNHTITAVGSSSNVSMTGNPQVVNACTNTVTVTNNNNSGTGSLRQAIAQVCTGGTIDFNANYTITLASQLTVDKTITITGNGAANTIIRAAALPNTVEYRVFLVYSNTLLQDLTVANGKCSGSCDSYGYGGGGILNGSLNATVNLTNVTFTGNRALHGGAVYNKGQMNIVNSTFSENQVSDGNGGAIYNNNTVIVTGSAFTDNLAAFTSSNGQGGAIYNNWYKSLDVTSSTFTGNIAHEGGGAIYRAGNGIVEVKNSIFTNNQVTTSGRRGGAIYTNGNTSDPLLVVNSEFSGNTTQGSGGAIYNLGGPMTVKSSAFFSNTASNGDGGGISTSGNSTIVNSTFSQNTAGNDGGGIHNYYATSSITNSTFYKNVAFVNNGGNVASFGSTPLTLKNTLLIHDATSNNCYGDITADSSNIETPFAPDPAIDSYYYCGNSITQKTEAEIKLDAILKNNGGFTKTFALLTGSPAINAGTNTGCPSTDQRGVSRPQSGTCDIGAFESYLQSGPAFVVNSGGDTNGDCEVAPGDCTLREAINTANTLPGDDAITFDNNYVITLTSSTQLPAIASTIIINGNGAANTIIQADATANNPAVYWRVFEVSGGDLTLNNLTVQNGRCNGLCDSNGSNGAGIYNGGTLTVTNSAIKDNYASNGNGGGIHDAGILTVTNASFSGNYAGSSGGGGIYISGNTVTITDSSFTDNHTNNNHGGAIHNVGNLTMIRSDVLNNSALGNGGGIYNHLLGDLSMIDSTITGNEANQGGGIRNDGDLIITSSAFNANLANGGGGSNGGAIDNEGNNAIVTNSTFAGNSALQYGGGIFNSGASAITITNSTFAKNSAVFGGGIFNTIGNNLSLRNTILADSPAPTDGDCYNNSGNTIGVNVNNLIETNGSGGYGCGTPRVTADPNLGDLKHNGGLTQTMLPRLNSPALGVGNSAVCSAAIGSPTFGAGGRDQRGFLRLSSWACDLGAVELGTAFRSAEANDGWTLESSENSNSGGTMSAAGKLRVGDDRTNRQVRSLLSFNTGNLPDNAILSSVTVRIYKSTTTTPDPFMTLGDLLADIKKGSFGLQSLQASDFSAAGAPIRTAGRFSAIPSQPGWYQMSLNPLYFQYVNLTGLTQFRIRFATDDNNNKIQNLVQFDSGGDANAPLLMIEYDVP